MDEVPRARLAAVLAASAVVLVALTGFVVGTQVEVADTTVDVTRTCGSVFDAVADRSGWEIWWARDLDEPDPDYTDRLVVAVVGLIVLAPTASLIVIGRALTILGGTAGGRNGVASVPQNAVTGDRDA
jgi:hypothetical protein